ncbi:unnamed protein product [Diamesa tonsa]
MSVVLYYTQISPPARACLLTIRNLNLDVDVINVDLFAGEHLKDEFLKLNPLHQVPVLSDDGFVMSESRAIMCYLVNSKKPGDSLYPNDPKVRAKIDQRLYYDTTVVFENNAEAIRPVIYDGEKTIKQEARDKFTDCFKVLDGYLEECKWIAGDNLTIADISLLATIVTVSEFGYDLTQHKNLHAWFTKCQALPGFEENRLGGKFLADIMASKIEGKLF